MQHTVPSGSCSVILQNLLQSVSLLISFINDGNEEGQAWQDLAEGF